MRAARQIVLLFSVALLAAALLALPAGAGAASSGSWPWLGLNGNSVKYLGPVETFSSHGIAYDRNFELFAGQVPSELEKGDEAEEFERRFAADRAEGMIPVVVVDYRGYDGDYSSDPWFPQARTPSEEAAGMTTSKQYVEGFVRTAKAILALADAGGHKTPVLFEPINEPWGYTTPQYDGAEYAAVIAELLPAAAKAGIPAESIYVGAVGSGWVKEMYAARPALRSTIEGWYMHPYGEDGMANVLTTRKAFSSGADNVVISEVGYCATDVNNRSRHEAGGRACEGQEVGSASVAAADLQETLEVGAEYHSEGWLKALIVFSRNDGGWAMQKYPQLTLTRSGRTLIEFADERAPGAMRSELIEPLTPNQSPQAEEEEEAFAGE